MRRLFVLSKSFCFREVSVFAIVGVVSTLTHTVIAMGVIYLFSTLATPANVIGYLSALPVSYYGHSRFSFRKSMSYPVFLRFIYFNTWLFGAATGISILCDFFNMPPYRSVIIVVGIMPAISYLVHKFVTFKNNPEKESNTSIQ